jgi:hypothetical protein
MNGDHIAEHFGRPAGSSLEWSSSAVNPQSLSVNVLYTNPEATRVALKAAEALAHDLAATIHLRAVLCVPCRLSIDCPPIPVSFFRLALCELVERIGSATCEYVLHIYVGRSRIETLLKVLRPSSLLVIAGRRRFWPTTESRVLKAASRAGHSVAFVSLAEW